MLLYFIGSIMSAASVSSSVALAYRAHGPPGERRTLECVMSSQLHKHTFIIRVRYDDRGAPLRHMIEVGGDGKRDCIEMLVNTYENFAHLNTVRHHSGCAIGSDFGRGASRSMLRAALECVRVLFPRVQGVRLMDKSYVPCGEVTVFLPAVHIALHGTTWYESKFGAHLGDGANSPEHVAYRERVDAMLHDVATKNALPWEDFQSLYKASDDLKAAYVHAATFGEFFGSLKRSAVNRDEFCLALIPWAEPFLVDYTQHDGTTILSPWTVDLLADDVYETGISLDARVAAGGGKHKFTRKRRIDVAPHEWVTQQALREKSAYLSRVRG
jgi:hypothetical protein